MLLEYGCSTSDLCLVRSPSGFIGVALCWNNKGYWCLKEVSARSFLVICKTLVIITVFIWCCPISPDIPLCYTSMQRYLTSDWGWQQVPSIPVIARELWHVCVSVYRSVSVYFSNEFNFRGSFLDLYLYIIHVKDTEKLWTLIKKYIAFYSWQLYVRWLFFCLQSCNGISEGEDVLWSFEGCQVSRSPALHCGS